MNAWTKWWQDWKEELRNTKEWEDRLMKAPPVKAGPESVAREASPTQGQERECPEVLQTWYFKGPENRKDFPEGVEVTRVSEKWIRYVYSDGERGIRSLSNFLRDLISYEEPKEETQVCPNCGNPSFADQGPCLTCLHIQSVARFHRNDEPEPKGIVFTEKEMDRLQTILKSTKLHAWNEIKRINEYEEHYGVLLIEANPIMHSLRELQQKQVGEIDSLINKLKR